MRRILSLWLPQFPIERLSIDLTRAGAALPYEPDQPFALVETGPKGLRLVAVDEVARACGLVTGERLTDARAKVPHLASAVHDAQADLSALLKLARWAERWSPWVALDPPDGLMLDITGIAHLFRGEKAMLAGIKTCFEGLGLTVIPGLAGTQKAARALARFSPEAPIARQNGEREALKPLPVDALGLDSETCHTLHRLGLKTIGQLYDIPRASLARRFRKTDAGEIVAQLDQALGLAEHPLDPLTSPPVFAVRHVLPEPLISNEGIETIISSLAEALCMRLHDAGQGARHVTCKLYRSDGSRITIPAGLACPSRDPRHIAGLFRYRLDSIDAGFGIDAATLEANEAAPLDLTQSSLAPGNAPPNRLRDGSALAELADRIANRPDGAGLKRLAPVESHIPERAQVSRPIGFAEPDQPDLIGNRPTTGDTPTRPITLLERPESVRVIATVPDGPPVRFTWRRLAHRIVRAQGPERIAPEWWRSATKLNQRPRDYYIVEDEAGRRYWLYREGLYGDPGTPEPQWFIHGLFA
ncbi:MAG: DNA polymerase Y family protein [Rhizobiales bacterium]|nr:DNA polymerase Y family protein [Hyphomicrobiales bacterium]